MGDASTTRKYVTDGSDTTFTSQGAEVKSSAKWDDNDARRHLQGGRCRVCTFNDKMTLSPDGKMLISNIHISSPQGDVDIMIAFDKQ